MNSKSNASEFLKRENSHNVWIDSITIQNMLHTYGLDLKVNNLKLFQQAFIHKSYLKPSADYKTTDITRNGHQIIPLQDSCNERLEILGDSIVGSTVVSYLYDRFPNESEGFITKNKTKIFNFLEKK